MGCHVYIVNLNHIEMDYWLVSYVQVTSKSLANKHVKFMRAVLEFVARCRPYKNLFRSWKTTWVCIDIYRFWKEISQYTQDIDGLSPYI